MIFKDSQDKTYVNKQKGSSNSNTVDLFSCLGPDSDFKKAATRLHQLVAKKSDAEYGDSTFTRREAREAKLDLK